MLLLCICLVELLLYASVAHSKVLVYTGPGVSPELVESFLSSLQSMGEVNLEVSRVPAAYFDAEQWEDDATMVMIPGGRDLEYLKDFSVSAIKRIRSWVEEWGGSLLGICAGAYFASGRVEFEPYGVFAVRGDRPLALYPGVAYGAALRPFDYVYNEHLPAANVRILGWKRSVIASVYQMGGCYFDEKEVLWHGWSVLAAYTHSNHPAIIFGSVGKGRVVLSCPHIEVSLKHLVGREGSWMYQQMAYTPNNRAALFQGIIRKLKHSN